MVSFLVTLGAGEGQTTKIADRIAETLATRGHDATTVDIEGTSADHLVDEFDAVLVGASIHIGKHQLVIHQFVKTNRESLAANPTEFCPDVVVVHDRGQAAPGRGGWRNQDVHRGDRMESHWFGPFGGVLWHSEYDFFKHLLMKRIAKDPTDGTDILQDYEYTDWNEVEAFTNDIAALVEPRLGVASPTAVVMEPDG